MRTSFKISTMRNMVTGFNIISQKPDKQHIKISYLNLIRLKRWKDSK